MEITKGERRLGILTGVLVAVQAAVWFIFSTICLVYYFRDVIVDTHLPLLVPEAIYLRFLNSFYTYNISDQRTLIEPAYFTSFNVIYVVLGGVWFLASINLIYAVAKKTDKVRKHIKRFFYITLTVSILDLILVVGLGIDHGKNCHGHITELEAELCDKAVIPVLIISARGFLFWFLNLGLACACLVKDFGEPMPDAVDDNLFTIGAVSHTSRMSYDYNQPRYRYEYSLALRPNFNGGYSYSYGLDFVYR